MITIFLFVLFIVYIALSWMIIYHLQTYTINKDLAKKAIIYFVSITVILVLTQSILFIINKNVVMDVLDNTQITTQTSF